MGSVSFSCHPGRERQGAQAAAGGDAALAVFAGSLPLEGGNGAPPEGGEAGNSSLLSDLPILPGGGDLKAEMDAFTSVDACAASRAPLDPVADDALEAIGYDTFLKDACRVIDAAHAKDARRCAAIDASGLRARCRATVAEVMGNPDGCPWEIPNRPASGRDPACLAIALRDARFCKAVLPSRSQATCEAVAARDAAPCAKLQHPADRTRCARTARRWATTISPSATPPLPLPFGGTLRARAVAAASLSDGDQDLAPSLSRGVVLLMRSKMSLTVDLTPLASRKPRLAVELFVVGRAGDLRLDHVAFHDSGDVRGSYAGLNVTLQKLQPTRGGAVEIHLDGEVGDPASRTHWNGTAVTFVRDVVSREALLGAEGADPEGSSDPP